MKYWFIWMTILTIIVHELGHFIDAKRLSIYKGWGILPTPHIKLTKPYPNRWIYLNGILASLATVPLWMLFTDWYPAILFCVALGSGDLFAMIIWRKKYLEE